MSVPGAQSVNGDYKKGVERTREGPLFSRSQAIFLLMKIVHKFGIRDLSLMQLSHRYHGTQI